MRAGTGLLLAALAHWAGGAFGVLVLVRFVVESHILLPTPAEASGEAFWILLCGLYLPQVVVRVPGALLAGVVVGHTELRHPYRAAAGVVCLVEVLLLGLGWWRWQWAAVPAADALKLSVEPLGALFLAALAPLGVRWVRLWRRWGEGRFPREAG